MLFSGLLPALCLHSHTSKLVSAQTQDRTFIEKEKCDICNRKATGRPLRLPDFHGILAVKASLAEREISHHGL